MTINRVRAYVQKYDPGLEPMAIEAQTATVEEAARALGVDPSQIAKTILFKAKEQYGLFVTAGDVRVHQKVARELLGAKPKLASPQECQQITGYPVGGVCPFDLKQDVPVYLDRSMERFDVVYIAAGTPSSALPITLEQLQHITGGQVVDMLAQR